ncbi:MAG: hypothetical protein CMC97_04320 [Flavobacteriales bacterium]|nr:hypothetical protein [Flavobacteriales bacterium]
MKSITVTRVLVIRFSSMGDVILTSPVVRALHALLEGEVEVHFLTKSAFAAAVQGLSGVKRVWTIDRTTAEVEEEMQAQGFHYVVDLHANARSAFLKRGLRKGEGRTFDLTVDKRSLDKIWLVRTGWDRLAGQHVVERYLDTLRPFGSALAALESRGDDGRLSLPHVEVTPSKSRKKVALALGAAHTGKSIPEAHWETIVAGVLEAGHVVHLVGGPEEAEMGQRLSAKHQSAALVNGAGELSWPETFSAMASADVLIVGDTGAMHAGAALQVPMVVVWGCTSPALGMGPWRAHPDTVQLEPEQPERSRPCSRLGDRCRHRTPCIHRVSPQRILGAVGDIFS